MCLSCDSPLLVIVLSVILYILYILLTVFAYGATGAGKTFTMLGNHQCPGVIFSTMMELYDRIDKMKEEKTCDVAVSYLEV